MGYRSPATAGLFHFPVDRANMHLETARSESRDNPRQYGAFSGAKLGAYEIVAPLGAGGMGKVYRARDTRLGREVAIKVVVPQLAQNAEALARFEREARVVASLSHPNIVTLHDVGTVGEVFFVVLELLEGETLRARLSRSLMPWPEAVKIGLSVCRGLAAAQDKGLVHRDLKPENVFLTTEGSVKILDFGLARRLPASAGGDGGLFASYAGRGATEPGMVMGTIGYMSPEQARGDNVESSSDLFSLGCVLYEMISGRYRGLLELQLKERMEAAKSRPVSPWDVAMLHARLGQHDEAFEWLENSYAERFAFLVQPKVEPFLKPLHSDPRFGRSRPPGWRAVSRRATEPQLSFDRARGRQG